MIDWRFRNRTLIEQQMARCLFDSCLNTSSAAAGAGRRTKAALLALIFTAAGVNQIFPAPAFGEERVLAAAGETVIDPAGLLGPAFSSGPASLEISGSLPRSGQIDLNGWDYLYTELRKSGIDQHTLIRLFTDPRMPRRETLYFGLNPKEPHQLYRKHNSRAARKHALSFYSGLSDVFKKAEQRFGVPKSLILAILQIETGCGGNTGSSRVFYQLARLSIAADPANIEKNLDRFPESERERYRKQVTARAQYLRDTFLPHVAGTIKLSERLKINPLELRGSTAGAVGLGQFLPGNVLTLGVDGNGDHFVDPFSAADSVMSVAHFLKSHGWSGPRMSTSDKRSVIWHYNRSDAYIDTVLAMSRALDSHLCGDIVCRKVPAAPIKRKNSSANSPSGAAPSPAKPLRQQNLGRN